jgi:multisubunit Na+/H+ antiporter MnhF subunit
MTEDEVFEQALEKALRPGEHGAPPGDGDALKAVLQGAKSWVLASARTQQQRYAELHDRELDDALASAARHPFLWRCLLLVLIPLLAWYFTPVLVKVPLGTRALVLVSLGAVVLATSYTDGIGKTIARTWAGLNWFVLGLILFLLAIGTLLNGEWIAGAAVVLVLLGFVVSVPRLLRASFTLWPPPDVARKAAEVERALDEWRSVIFSDGVLPTLRAELGGTRIVPGNELTFGNAGSLQRGGSLISHQPVPAGTELAALLDTLDGGSFALAGPRGSGKTSLLRAYCQGAYRRQGQAVDLTVLVAAPVDYVPREFVLHLYAQTCNAVLAHLRAADPKILRRRRQDDRVQLARSAHRGLRDVAYVQTLAGETSGKFGFRGAELAYKRGTSLTGRPRTFPEVVDDFRQFVRTVARTLEPVRVVIAIDEIDRIGAGEPARRFLNEIKAVFDVPGCYYLMAVSTEAQHDFELAGMGLRSVFDSSFDEVVRVDYLDFQLARGLISRSVDGLPEVFVALAYAFSGGLARQLTRSARAIVRQPRGTLLADVAEKLISDELDRVCKTTSDALTALDDRDGVTKLLRVLADPDLDLHVCYERVQAAYDGEHTSISDLRDRAAARIAFLAVVRDFFTNDLAEVLPEQVNALARARRYAGSNPATGLALLEEFSSAATARPAPARSPR